MENAEQRMNRAFWIRKTKLNEIGMKHSLWWWGKPIYIFLAFRFIGWKSNFRVRGCMYGNKKKISKEVVHDDSKISFALCVTHPSEVDDGWSASYVSGWSRTRWMQLEARSTIFIGRNWSRGTFDAICAYWWKIVVNTELKMLSLTPIYGIWKQINVRILNFFCRFVWT